MMAIEQKIRSLSCGMPVGIQFQEVGEMTVLPLSAVPYELERTIENWILALPAELHADALYVVDGVPEALTHAGWCAFVSWMLQSLTEAQSASNFRHTVTQCSLKSFR
ncbi:hypothetical protein [Janthinobacterium agaricidamnosum]|uniref:hypothetical protein n=1 Tax=Janthinobacterium agaricidamnosum TaxID=55508 RepID=UPI0011864EE5|nr:hypothetical protein [Janthinobacterium agaricidamnosum]